jgi:hypothetical protein
MQSAAFARAPRTSMAKPLRSPSVPDKTAEHRQWQEGGLHPSRGPVVLKLASVGRIASALRLLDSTFISPGVKCRERPGRQTPFRGS